MLKLVGALTLAVSLAVGVGLLTQTISFSIHTSLTQKGQTKVQEYRNALISHIK